MNLNKFNLKGKTALITGAAGLLGTEHAAALLSCGAKVVLTDISENQLKITKSRLTQEYNEKNIITTVMDVTKQEEISNTVQDLKQKKIRIDILVNNAAIDPKVKCEDGIIETTRLENFSLDQWNQQVAVGLTGAFLCSQAFGKLMSEDGIGGVIINVASDLSIIAPDQRLYRKENIPEELQPVKPVTYSVIKAGLIGLTRYLSTYWADRGVRCNALSPGGVYFQQGNEFVNRISALVPMKRMANQDEYRAAIQFLCSDASAYMNGQNLVIDGGRSVW